jgi:hypothetical protein
MARKWFDFSLMPARFVRYQQVEASSATRSAVAVAGDPDVGGVIDEGI